MIQKDLSAGDASEKTFSDRSIVSSLKALMSGWYGSVLCVVLALFLDLFRLGERGYSNLYYAAAVRSMLINWHNFFFVSFDPDGFVSIPLVGAIVVLVVATRFLLFFQCSRCAIIPIHSIRMFLAMHRSTIIISL